MLLKLGRNDDMSDVKTFCRVCGKMATNTCSMCGKAVCDRHYDAKSGLCDICKSGMRFK